MLVCDTPYIYISIPKQIEQSFITILVGLYFGYIKYINLIKYLPAARFISILPPSTPGADQIVRAARQMGMILSGKIGGFPTVSGTKKGRFNRKFSSKPIQAFIATLRVLLALQKKS
jgi:hypothetical protein